MDLVTILVVLLVAVFIVWLFAGYVAPAFPQPVGNVATAIFALIFIIVILQVTGLLDSALLFR